MVCHQAELILFWPFIKIAKSIGLCSLPSSSASGNYVRQILFSQYPFTRFYWCSSCHLFRIIASWFALWYFIVTLSLSFFLLNLLQILSHYEMGRDSCIYPSIDTLLPDDKDVFKFQCMMKFILASAFVWNGFFFQAFLCCQTKQLTMTLNYTSSWRSINNIQVLCALFTEHVSQVESLDNINSIELVRQQWF